MIDEEEKVDYGIPSRARSFWVIHMIGVKLTPIIGVDLTHVMTICAADIGVVRFCVKIPRMDHP